MTTDDTPRRGGALSRLVDRLRLPRESEEAQVARERHDWWQPELERAVAVLAADPDAQRDWLRCLFGGQPPGDADELALHFDGLWMEGRIQHAIGISAAVRGRLDALDSALDEMSGPEHAELWTLDALSDRPGWANIRQLAAVAGEALRRDFHPTTGA
jgi:hypothetical protein